MARFKDLHIVNSKNYKRWYCPHHTDFRSILMFYCRCFIDFLFQLRDLWDASADRREILHGDQY